jgi:hypothetical protein
MGRGRAKAKQTKVARELKYSSPNTDLTSLQRELAGSSSSEHSSREVDLPALDGDDQSDDGYGDWTAEERR